MSKRRSFLKAIVALPIVAKAAPVTAKLVEPESDAKVICPHCFELTGRGHASTCDGFAAWKLENET